jgi:hypothetical protein
MDYSGPDPADFANVTSLNYAFLLNLREPARGQSLRQTMTARVRPIIRDLTDLQLERLSATPFLLMSLRERDVDYWQTLLGKDTNRDLFDRVITAPETEQLATAGVAFLWQLARLNPYAARLLSGATLGWCEQLAEHTLLRLLQQTCGRNDLLQPRFASNDEFWTKLLGPGLSSEAQVRNAAHLAALQSILTEDPVAQYRPFKAAACSTLLPSVRIAGRKD